MHPYTRGLMASMPRLDLPIMGQRLAEIPGVVPSLREDIVGCPFAPRCSFAVERCSVEMPPLEEKAGRHRVACWETERVKAAHG